MPTLSPEQLEVVRHRDSHLQVIACAGSGKTESVACRVAELIAECVPPAAIVAFTFTERAAAELKERILLRVEERCGVAAKGPMARMFVGTIHGYCYRLLQDHVPSIGNYDVLDPHRHVGLLYRERRRLALDRLGLQGAWQSVRDFVSTVDVLGNELITPKDLAGDPLADVYRDYLDLLDRYQVLTFSLQIQKAVEALKDPRVFEAVHGPLRHLIVDEFQDINPAQEALIRRLAAPPVQLCVVGDDDQSIYQWRGSDVRPIRDFQRAYKARSVTLATNRRSRREIVEHAERFAKTIPKRLPKTMLAHRDRAADAVIPWLGGSPEEEADTAADAIAALHAKGHAYADIAILFRSVRTSAPVFIDALRAREIPYTCVGRTGLFLQPEIELLGMTYAWLGDFTWRPPGYGQEEITITDKGLVTDYARLFAPKRKPAEIRGLLTDWKNLVPSTDKPVNLIRDYYQFLRFLGVHEWDADDRVQSARLGALARFSQILADYEGVTRRARWETDESGVVELRGAQDRGEWYYKNLALYLLHYAKDEYEEFEGEADPDLDAVDIVTVHQAKGLQWPIVFLPGLSSRRFPSSNAGRARDWLIPERVLPAATRKRYEGGEDEERRLFYVAVTRAQDSVYLSSFQRTAKQAARPSHFLTDLLGTHPKYVARLPVPSPVPRPETAVPPVSVTFSQVAAYEDCGHRYRLAESFGFQNQLATELGYGRAVHHVLRQVAESARITGRVPTADQALAVLDEEFFLPYANSANFDGLRDQARRLVSRYLSAYQDDLRRVWATERAFEMYLPEGTLSGRADVILDHHDGHPDALAIVDYKTAKGEGKDAVFAFQLAVYAAAGRAEGLDVRAGLLHHLYEGARAEVDVGPAATAAAVKRVGSLVSRLRTRAFVAEPDGSKCRRCDYRLLCPHPPKDPWQDD